MIKVLVVDDSVVVRRLLSDALGSDPRISVIGSAANGSIALQKIEQLNPEVVILDVEMPDMDGIETVARIRKTHADLPVIMCSALTEQGAVVTLRALTAGATDYITKPSAQAVQQDRLNVFKSDLIAKVVALGERKRATIAPAASLPPIEQKSRVRSGREPVTALAIGCSTGGPNALATLFEGIPPTLPVPIFIVQHMPPLFTKILADRLAASSGVRVFEARHGEEIEPGSVYIAPGNFHLTVGPDSGRARLLTQLNQDAPENSCRPAVDVTFRSLAATYRSGVLGCVLTGMGHDGALGAQAIVDAGGVMLAQSVETCVVSSMPRAVIDAGLAEQVLPLSQIAAELVRRVQRTTSFRAPERALSQREM